MKIDKSKMVRYYNFTKWIILLYCSGILSCFSFLILAPKELRHTLVGVGDYLKGENKKVEDPQLPQGVLPPLNKILRPQDIEPVTTGVMVPLEEEYEIQEDFLLNGEDLGKLQKLPMLFTPKEIEALIKVESNGDVYRIGDNDPKYNGKWSYGCLQQRTENVRDINKKYGTKIVVDDLLGNKELSIACMNAYMHIYCPNGTFEERASVHNKGPNAKIKSHKQYELAAPYREKVKKAYASL